MEKFMGITSISSSSTNFGGRSQVESVKILYGFVLLMKTAPFQNDWRQLPPSVRPLPPGNAEKPFPAVGIVFSFLWLHYK